MNDRDAILSRRTLLLQAAMASLTHCTPASEPVGPSTVGGGSAPPSATPSGPPSASGPRPASSAGAPKAPAALPPFPTIVASRPRAVAPAGLSPEGKAKFDAMMATVTPGYSTLESIWTSGEELCRGDVPECREAWRTLEKPLWELRDLKRDRNLCGGGIHPQSLERLRQAHVAFLMAEVDRFVAQRTQLAESFGELGSQEWRRISASISRTRPMPCLSCAMPDLPILDVIQFDKDADTIGPQYGDALKRIAAKMNIAGERIELWGHALESERDPLALSERRAKATVSALRANGAKAKLVGIAVGSDLSLADVARASVEFVGPAR